MFITDLYFYRIVLFLTSSISNPRMSCMYSGKPVIKVYAPHKQPKWAVIIANTGPEVHMDFHGVFPISKPEMEIRIIIIN